MASSLLQRVCFFTAAARLFFCQSGSDSRWWCLGATLRLQGRLFQDGSDVFKRSGLTTEQRPTPSHTRLSSVHSICVPKEGNTRVLAQPGNNSIVIFLFETTCVTTELCGSRRIARVILVRRMVHCQKWLPWAGSISALFSVSNQYMWLYASAFACIQPAAPGTACSSPHLHIPTTTQHRHC